MASAQRDRKRGTARGSTAVAALLAADSGVEAPASGDSSDSDATSSESSETSAPGEIGPTAPPADTSMTEAESELASPSSYERDREDAEAAWFKTVTVALVGVIVVAVVAVVIWRGSGTDQSDSELQLRLTDLEGVAGQPLASFDAALFDRQLDAVIVSAAGVSDPPAGLFTTLRDLVLKLSTALPGDVLDRSPSDPVDPRIASLLIAHAVLAADVPDDLVPDGARDFGGADLRGLDLSSADPAIDLSHYGFAEANFGGARLWLDGEGGVRMHHCDLTGVLVADADLRGVDLGHAKLDDGRFYRVNLYGAVFDDVSAADLDFFGGDLKRTRWTRAHLIDCGFGAEPDGVLDAGHVERSAIGGNDAVAGPPPGADLDELASMLQDEADQSGRPEAGRDATEALQRFAAGDHDAAEGARPGTDLDELASMLQAAADQSGRPEAGRDATKALQRSAADRMQRTGEWVTDLSFASFSDATLERVTFAAVQLIDTKFIDGTTLTECTFTADATLIGTSFVDAEIDPEKAISRDAYQLRVAFE